MTTASVRPLATVSIESNIQTNPVHISLAGRGCVLHTATVITADNCGVVMHCHICFSVLFRTFEGLDLEDLFLDVGTRLVSRRLNDFPTGL